MTDKPKYTNRLIQEKSPYLLQHAHNPVNWYPWGEEAFEKAMDDNKPIFLSIGYATCHWCHVMEQETFENPKIADKMNKLFVNIKVDREELPEVDALYMEFAQGMMPGAAGWPLNVVLTPDLKPFFAATYLPPSTSKGMMGIEELIEKIHNMWTSSERENVIEQANKIVDIYEETVHIQGDEMPTKDHISIAIDLLYKMVDPAYGGMKGAPKFPIGFQANLLIRYSAIENDGRAGFIVERTLKMMHKGGIFDHLGGGFSRYSTDEKWLVPHFEKMLYDNAFLIDAYLEVWKSEKRPIYRTVCDQITSYILREMTHKDGGFYSAQDADSDGVEGKYYTWTIEEINAVLTPEESALCCDFYDIKKYGEVEGRNVLNTKLDLEEFAVERALDKEILESQILQINKKLFSAREKRVPPTKDDKILTSWNGMMIHSIATTGATLNRPDLIDAASKAATFIMDHLWVDNQLLRRWRDGEPAFYATLDDYAYLIRGLITLFEVGRGTKWLEWAIELTDQLEMHFKEDDGAFYQTDGLDPYLLLRKSQFSDGAEPSGNAIHCENLLRLHALSYDKSYLNQAEDIFRAVKSYLDMYPVGYSYHLMNLIRYFDTNNVTIVIALNENRDYESEIYSKLFTNFIYHKNIIWRRQNDNNLFNILPFAEIQVPLNDMTTVYICRQGICLEPLTDIGKVMKAIDEL